MPAPPKLGGRGSEPLLLPFLVRALVPPELGGWGSEPLPFPFLVRALAPPESGGWGSEPLPFSLRPLYSCAHLLSKYPDNGLWTDGLCPYLFNDIQPAFLFVCTAGR